MPKERIIQSEIMRKRLNKIIEEDLTDWLGREHYMIEGSERERVTGMDMMMLT